jgi:hypothetical protein
VVLLYAGIGNKMNIQDYLKRHSLYGPNFGLRAKQKKLGGRFERINFNPGAPLTLMDESGAGVIDAIWFAIDNREVTFDGNAPFQKMILRIFIDGEVTPSVEFDCGTLGYWNTPSSGSYATNHLHHESLGLNPANNKAKGGGLTFKFPIPYANHIKITIENPDANPGFLYSFIYYTPEVYIPLKLMSFNIPWSNKITISALTPVEYEFFNLTNTEGWLIWHSIILKGNTNNSFAESKIKVFIDGESSPSINSPDLPSMFGELKDFAFTTAFMSAVNMYLNPWRTIVPCDLVGTHQVSLGLDLMAWLGGLYFTSGARAVLDPTHLP